MQSKHQDVFICTFDFTSRDLRKNVPKKIIVIMNFLKYMRAHYFKTIFLYFLPHKQVFNGIKQSYFW